MLSKEQAEAAAEALVGERRARLRAEVERRAAETRKRTRVQIGAVVGALAGFAGGYYLLGNDVLTIRNIATALVLGSFVGIVIARSATRD